MASILFLKDLEHTLQYWEDVNRYNESLFQFSLVLRSEEIPNYTQPLIGSEVDGSRHLRRPIKNFKGLRHMVEDRVSISDSTVFLPRVPKQQRGNFGKSVDYMRSDLTQNITFFPYVLGEWLKYKKVFSLSNVEQIKPVSVYKKNYLRSIPYSSFIITLDDPTNIYFPTTNHERGYKTIMISSDGETIDVFLIVDNISTFLMGESERKSLEKISFNSNDLTDARKKLSKVPRFNPMVRFGGFSIEISTGNKIFSNFTLEGKKFVTSYDFSDDVSSMLTTINGELWKNKETELKDEVLTIVTYHQKLIEFLNGFCKIISELTSKQTEVLFNDIPHEKNFRYEINQWNAIPITNFYHLHENPQDATKETILIARGNEKSPHWRRGHWRTYKNTDGTLREKVWIGEMIIREDKLETENLQGNVTVLKD